MAVTDLMIVRRSLTGRLFSTVVTTLTVGVSVGLMLTLLGMRDAGQQAFSRGTGNMHLLLSRDDSALVSVLNSIFYAEPPRAPIRMDELDVFLESPRGNLPPIGAQLEYAVPIQQGDSYKGHPVVSTTRAYFESFEPVVGAPWELEEGRLIEARNDPPYEVVIGAGVARHTNLSVGDEVYLTHGAGSGQAGSHQHDEYPFKVVGVLKPTGTPHDRALFTELTSSWVLHAHDIRAREGTLEGAVSGASLTPQERQVTGVYMRTLTRRGSGTSAVYQQVFDQIRRDPRYTVASPAEEVKKLFKIVSNVDKVFIGLAAAVMVSGGVSIMLALYNSMAQRRRQIAVLRVLGASRMKIFGLVLTESAMLGVFGAAFGIVVGFLGAAVTADVLRSTLGLVINPSIGFDWVLILIVATVGLASLAGLVPAIAAYRTSVARNLRPLS